MKRKNNWLVPIRAGVFVAFLPIICLVATHYFFPELFPSHTNVQSEATAELFAMDTHITMTAYGRNAETALSKVKDKLTELEWLWSVTEPSSDIYAVNHSDGQPISISEETAELLSFTLQMADETNGALEPTIYPVLTTWGFTTEENRVPSGTEVTELLKNVGYERIRLDDTTVQLDSNMMVDLDSVGKGYAGALATQVLTENGITSALLDPGGNIQAVGAKPDGSPWRLGLRDPFSEDTLGVMEINNRAVVTSGAYERYFLGEDGTRYRHIIDPATGYPAESGLASSTVIAEEGRLCDALSTSLYVMGLSKAVEYWRQHHNFDMLLVTEDGEIYLTDGIADCFTLDSYHSNMAVNVIQDE